MNRFKWMKAFFSPFKRPKIKLYIGKIAVGTPYFLPRRWVKYTKKEIKIKIEESLTNDKIPIYLREGENLQEALKKYYTGIQHAIPRKIGFDFVGLGWKTKWGDYRHKWNPTWSFVFFKWQIALIFVPKHSNHYWESWLYYELDTDKSMSKMERTEHCLKNAPQIWISYNKDGSKTTTNYYTKILKKKYLKLIKT